MALKFTTSYLEDALSLYRYYKKLAEGAMAQAKDEELFAQIDPENNSIAITVKHMAGNMRSRFTDFLTSDGEKPDRNRDSEFEEPPATRDALMEIVGRRMGLRLSCAGAAVGGRSRANHHDSRRSRIR